MSYKEIVLAVLAISAVVMLACVLLMRFFRRTGFGSAGLFYALFGLFGLFAFAYGAHEFVLGFQSRNWQRVEGFITLAEMTTQHDQEHGDTHGANVSYEYRVGGSNYTGTRFCFGDYASSDGEHAAAILARYQAGAKATVFYDENKPERAVLEPGIHFGAWLGLGIGTLFLAFATYSFSRGRVTAG
jgi:Protein of unknown function (DUF3592)